MWLEIKLIQYEPLGVYSNSCEHIWQSHWWSFNKVQFKKTEMKWYTVLSWNAMCTDKWMWSVCVFVVWFIKVYQCTVCMCGCVLFVCPVVLREAHHPTDDTQNASWPLMKKLMGHFLIYQFTVGLFRHTQSTSGRLWPTPLDTSTERSNVFFCGHQMLWIMMRPLNANRMTLDRPWSTVPAWELLPTDTMKRGKAHRAAISRTKHLPAASHLSDMM